jgi:circadian clock protein KaiB
MSGPAVLLRLYVAGHLPSSQRALANLTSFCRQHLPEGHRIEIIDIFENPERALKDEIFITPALVVLTPPPIRKVVGILSDAGILERLLAAEIRNVGGRTEQVPPP